MKNPNLPVLKKQWKKKMEDEGMKVDIVSPQKYKVKAWNHDHWTIELGVDVNLPDANPDDYDALMIPGGVLNSGKLRLIKIV